MNVSNTSWRNELRHFRLDVVQETSPARLAIERRRFRIPKPRLGGASAPGPSLSADCAMPAI